MISIEAVLSSSERLTSRAHAEALAASPSASLADLARATGIPKGTVRWHVDRLSSHLAIATMVNWRWTGYNALIFLAAMQAIPRDLYVEIAETGSKAKINAAYNGGPRRLILTVQQALGIPVHHYLEVDFDLSEVMFVCTANSLNIPAPLLDRMEVIRLPGYTEDEKLNIAKQYLLPKQIKANGVNEGELEVTDNAIRAVIRHYTREAGVRNLERQIASVVRGIAVKVAEGEEGPWTIQGEEDLRPFLGPARFTSEVAERTAETGVATGLAWTSVGGEISSDSRAGNGCEIGAISTSGSLNFGFGCRRGGGAAPAFSPAAGRGAGGFSPAAGRGTAFSPAAGRGAPALK